MFNPNRLSLARKRAGLTAKGFAEEIGISPVTITRLEKGQNEPDIDTLDRIVNSLNFPKNFFFEEDIDEINKEGASFRSLTAMTAKERDSALSAGSIAFLFSDWAAQQFNLPEVDLLDLGKGVCPEEAAVSLRDNWGLGEQPISNMIKLLESKGVKVFSLAENTKNVDAFSCWRGNEPYVFLNTYKTAEHSRFDAAHELGHLILHKHGGPDQGNDAKEETKANVREIENEANLFASAFLMPKDDIISRVPSVSSLDQLIVAKKRWGVSVAALTYRLNKMGLLSEWLNRQLWKQINQRGYRTSEPEGLENEKSGIWEKVFTQLWEDKISKERVAKQLYIPVGEVENLVFGFMDNLSGNDINKEKASLEIVEESNPTQP